jgi:hypothetical protein
MKSNFLFSYLNITMLKFNEYHQIQESAVNEILVNPALKLKIRKNQFGEFEVRVLRLVGKVWRSNEKETAFMSDLQDAIGTMQDMARRMTVSSAPNQA